MNEILALLVGLEGKTTAEQYIDVYTALELLGEKQDELKKQLVEDDQFMEAINDSGVKLTRIVTQRFVPNKSVEELKFLFPSAVLTEVIPATEEKTVESINVDLLRADPEAHQFLDTKRSETVKVTKPKAAK